MSWYVSTILRNSIEIKSKHDMESDLYNDLLVLESKIQNLYNDGIISDEELKIIKYVEDGKPIVNTKKEYGKNRMAASKDFSNVCTKIAFYAGGYFTDEGYVNYMMKKYNLTESQVEIMLEYMKSRYKYKLIRNPKNE